MDQFIKYLNGTRDYLINVLQIFGETPDIETRILVSVTRSNLDLINDIIHHFQLFVKEENRDG